jgi:L-rhamnose isomerase
MIKAATVARKFWELAGTWKEVERAEYRLAYSHKKAQQLDKALAHASTCIEIIVKNGSDPFELFFGYEALGMVEKDRNNQIGFNKAVEKMRSLYENISPDLQAWCSDSFKKFE